MPLNAFTDLFTTVSATMARAADSDLPHQIARAVDLIERSLSQGGKILVFGNGGSAADAQHIAAELVGRFVRHRPSLPAIALTSNPAILTAWSNDHSFDQVFARQIEALGKRGDVAWGISTSGDSPNVVTAMHRARELGLATIGLTGGTGGRLVAHCDVAMIAPATETPRIQEIHVVAYHGICAALEDRLFREG